jgi:hypothetical protein
MTCSYECLASRAAVCGRHYVTLARALGYEHSAADCPFREAVAMALIRGCWIEKGEIDASGLALRNQQT